MTHKISLSVPFGKFHGGIGSFLSKRTKHAKVKNNSTEIKKTPNLSFRKSFKLTLLIKNQNAKQFYALWQ